MLMVPPFQQIDGNMTSWTILSTRVQLEIVILSCRSGGLKTIKVCLPPHQQSKYCGFNGIRRKATLFLESCSYKISHVTVIWKINCRAGISLAKVIKYPRYKDLKPPVMDPPPSAHILRVSWNGLACFLASDTCNLSLIRSPGTWSKEVGKAENAPPSAITKGSVNSLFRYEDAIDFPVS